MAYLNRGFERGQGEKGQNRTEGPKTKQTYVLERKNYSKDCTCVPYLLREYRQIM